MTTTTETKCCDKCYSTYTTDDYPDHKTLDACINRNCECHNSEEKDDSHYIPNLGIEYKITKSAEVNIGGNGSSATPEVTEIEEVVKEFWTKVNEVARETHWGDEQDSPDHEFGYKTQRQTDKFGGMPELFTVTDFGNIAKWLRITLLSQQQKHSEEIEKLKIDLEAEKMSRAIDNTNN